ncbi:27738_t:CDS:2, partial [Gigaspora margarita]
TDEPVSDISNMLGQATLSKHTSDLEFIHDNHQDDIDDDSPRSETVNDTLDSNNKESHNIRKSSKKMNRDKKRKTSLDTL